MNSQDDQIRRSYFRLEEAQRQRLWMQRLLHPELMKWTKHGSPPPMTETKEVRIQELAAMGFGEEHYQKMVREEASAKASLEELAEGHALWVHTQRIKGFGPYLTGAFVAAGGDVFRAPTVSSFWRGMGLDLVDGKPPRRVRGRKDVERRIPALPHVTRVGEQIRQQMLRGHGKLYDLYAEFRAKEPPEKVKMFAFKSALRKTQKVLYATLWEEWRKAYGLPAPEPYAFALLGHNGTRYRVADFYDR